MNEAITTEITSQLSKLEELLFHLHRDEQDNRRFNELGYAWMCVKQARDAIAGTMTPEVDTRDTERLNWLMSDDGFEWATYHTSMLRRGALSRETIDEAMARSNIAVSQCRTPDDKAGRT